MKKEHVSLDEFISDEWAAGLGVREVPITNRVLVLFGACVFLVGAAISFRILQLSFFTDRAYARQAEANLAQNRELPPPRGLIYDRFGKRLAANKESFMVFLNAGEFLRRKDLREKTVGAITGVIGMPENELSARLSETNIERTGERVLLSSGITSKQVIALRDLDLPTLAVEEGFARAYEDGLVFSSVVGYTGLVGPADIKSDSTLGAQAIVGRSGLEYVYDALLRGRPGSVSQVRNAKGMPLGEPEIRPPEIGASITLTIDADFSRYFAKRFREGLAALGKTTGVGIAINPQTGEVLALLNFPGFDNSIFSEQGRSDERKALLSSSLKPLFNRAVSGMYNPGSTIKPLVAVAALAENVIAPERQIFSPGYLDVPNPYDPEKPTRYLDWRNQGWINTETAIAKSSNVYFYTVGGGHGDIAGLGISRLHAWWQKFGLGLPTGIDLPFEAEGRLPSVQAKELATGEPWRLGDTYNVSIGQGDLLLTPIQLLNYVSAIANKGKMYRPFIASGLRAPEVIADLSGAASEMQEVAKGMIATTKHPEGTAYSLRNLPFTVAAKTGTAQVVSKTQENALFVGYAPAENPQIAILVLIENSREGSVNTIPIAKDVLNWYYWNRIKNSK